MSVSSGADSRDQANAPGGGRATGDREAVPSSDTAADGSGRAWAARLPFEVALGPHRLAVEWRDPAHMLQGRRRVCINLEARRIELRQDLGGVALAGAFLDGLIALGHRRAGHGPIGLEASHAHALATVLVEFAQRNPRAWLWFNLLLSHAWPGCRQFDRAVRGALAAPPVAPRHIVVCGQVVGLRCVELANGRCEGVSAIGYQRARREVHLPQGVGGTTLAVVALLEITHAIHDAYGLRPRDTQRRYREAEVDGWLGIMRDSPAAWRWLAWAMSPAHAARRR